MSTQLNTLAQDIVELHHHFTEQWHGQPDATPPDNVFAALIISQHQQNFDLWHEEDKAREPGAADGVIAQVKRNIDGLNQRRNDMITEIDLWMADNFFAAHHDDGLPWNSETLGSIIDRLSIASLKVFHMQEQTKRTEADLQHINSCKEKLTRLLQQRKDLSQALQQFVNDICVGSKQNKMYRQFKMYNDPALNPKIYNKPS